MISQIIQSRRLKFAAHLVRSKEPASRLLLEGRRRVDGRVLAKKFCFGLTHMWMIINE